MGSGRELGVIFLFGSREKNTNEQETNHTSRDEIEGRRKNSAMKQGGKRLQ